MEDFKKFVENENKKKSESQFNPNERIHEFRRFVNIFYQSVESDWLYPFIESDEISTVEIERRIEEQFLGQYNINEKIIIIGNQSLFLRPVGTMLPGSFGRIDLTYEARSEMFVLVNPQIETPKQMLDNMYYNSMFNELHEDLIWKFVIKQPRLKYETITSDVFQKVIMEIIYG